MTDADLKRERDEARSHLAMFESMAVEAIKDHDRAAAQRDALHLALLEAINVHPIIEEYPATKDALAALGDS